MPAPLAAALKYIHRLNERNNKKIVFKNPGDKNNNYNS